MEDESRFEVTWVIEVDGPTARDAAAQAREIQLDPTNIATFYHVKSIENGTEQVIDLATDA